MSEFKQTIEDLNKGWSTNEATSQPFKIKKDGEENQWQSLHPRTESRGSVKERAIKMELADEEAAQIEDEMKKAESNPSFIQKILKRFRGDKPNSTEPDAQKRLDEVVVDRVIGSDLYSISLSTDVSKLLRFLEPDGFSQLYNKKEVNNFTPEQRQLAEKKILEAVEKRKDRMEKNVIGELNYNLKEASSLDGLFESIGMWKPDDQAEYPYQEVADKVKSKIKPRIEAEHHSGSVASTLATEVEELFEKRYKELKKAEQKKK